METGLCFDFFMLSCANRSMGTFRVMHQELCKVDMGAETELRQELVNIIVIVEDEILSVDLVEN